MDSGRLPVEIEIGPRFEIFYALHRLFSPPSPHADRWRKQARSRLESRLVDDATDLAPHTLMWAILADCSLSSERVETFEDLTAAIAALPAAELKATILAGVPVVRGVDLRAMFEAALRDPENYRERLIGVLRAFWTRGFADDFETVRPELVRMGRQLTAARAHATQANAGSKLGIPIEVDETTETLTAGRSGYAIPLARVGRIVLLPSAFNTHHWWTKRDDGESPVQIFFPVNDGTIGPNDAVAPSRRTQAPEQDNPAATRAPTNLRPELIFRALGDTTRYAIATILARSPTTPSDLSRQLKVSKPTITHHVHALRDAGLIIDGTGGGKLTLDRSKIEELSAAAATALFASEGKLKLAKTRKKAR